MKICKRTLNFIQVIDELGSICSCCWMPDAVIGNMLEKSFYEVYHSPKAQELRRKLAAQDYSVCWKENCPFLVNGTIERELIEILEPLEYPDELHLPMKASTIITALAVRVISIWNRGQMFYQSEAV